MSSPWRAARGPFLVLTPAVLALGMATAHAQLRTWPWLAMALVLVAGLAAHISVNAFNEVTDFQNGLDATTQRTPFSGGSGVLPAHPQLLPAVQRLAWGSLGVVVVVGAVLVAWRGWPLLLLGALGLVLVLSYSRHAVRSPWGSLVAPGLAFGPVMVVGAHLALGADLNGSVVLASLLPFFGVNNLLLLNQLPDVEADRRVGRRNWPIVFGTRASVRLYGAMLLLMVACVLVGVFSGLWPLSATWTAVMLVPAWWVWRDLHALPEGGVPSHRTLALNVVLAVVTPVGLSLACLRA